MPTVQGILETALYVKDLKAAAAFYRRLFQLGTLLESERLIALDVAGRSILLLFQEGATTAPFPTPGGVIPAHAGKPPTHFAFAIAVADVPAWTEQLQVQGVALESRVNWEGGAISLYFRDPDQNLVELITPGFWRTF